jgi:hypothetical protein
VDLIEEPLKLDSLLGGIGLADVFSFVGREGDGRLAFSGPGDSGGA